MGRRKKGRLLDGVLLLDKPLDITSNGALQKVRWLYDARRAGHTGALDPLATGVLPICFGEATKFAKYLLESDKAYYTTAQLGEIRESGDSEGEVVETRDLPVLNKEIVESVLEKFRGETLQVPTMYSALKHQGRPLYEWARKGITVEREARPINVPTLRLDDVTRDTLSLYVECSKGTYIRSLVEDIGLELGCGAHVSMLRRSRAGHFELSETVTLEDLKSLEGKIEHLDAFLQPIDILLPNLPHISVNNSQTRSLLQGQPVRISPAENSGLHRVYAPKQAVEDLVGPILNIAKASALGEEWLFAGVVEVNDGEAKPKRLLNFMAES
ncbi:MULTISPECIES: tRNA pseudouridine(55) synthase TruB [unclassified Oleiphilus]|nr:MULTISPECIES: tRNA pseudouridine(55) synthase TruB [unclassified Oleiphilus]